jgi:hypothetical protein
MGKKKMLMSMNLNGGPMPDLLHHNRKAFGRESKIVKTTPLSTKAYRPAIPHEFRAQALQLLVTFAAAVMALGYLCLVVSCRP